MTVPNDSDFIGNRVTELQFKNALVILLNHIRDVTNDVIIAQGGKYGYATLAEFETVKATIPAGSIITIGEAGNYQGDNFWNGITLVKSAYDPITQAKAYTDSELQNIAKESLAALAQTISYLFTNADDTDEFALNDKHNVVDAAKNLLYLIDKNGIQFVSPIRIQNAHFSNEIESEDNEFDLIDKSAFIIVDRENNVILNSTEIREAISKIRMLSSCVNLLADVPEQIEDIQQKLNDGAETKYVPFVQKNNAFIYSGSDNHEYQISNIASPSNPRSLDKTMALFDSTDSEVPTFSVRYSDFDVRPLMPRKKLCGWGHSFIENPVFLNTLSVLSGLPTYNFGASGNTSVAIVARQNSRPLSFNTATKKIPASVTPVELTPFIYGLIVIESDKPKVNFCGIDGTLSYSQSQQKLYFTRTSAGSEVALSEAQEIHFYPITKQNTTTVNSGITYTQHDECINLFWMGRNNISQTNQIVSDAIAAIEYLKTKVKRFVILPDFPAIDEVEGTAGLAYVKALNAQLKSLYPHNYCEIDGIDLLKNFQNHLNPNDTTDVANVAAGSVPPSLLFDNLHPSESKKSNALYVGSEVNANFVYQFLVKKGWV